MQHSLIHYNKMEKNMAPLQTWQDPFRNLRDYASMGISQRFNKTKENAEGAAKIHSSDKSVCLQDHLKPYAAQIEAFTKQHVTDSSNTEGSQVKIDWPSW